MADTEPKKPLNLYQKLAAITGEIGEIKKEGRNTEQNFAFIEYAAVAGKLRTLFAKYGVVVVPRMQTAAKQHREEITSKYGKTGQAVLIDMSFTVVNADDPADKFTVTWTGEAQDYGDKATNKAATSALKYYLMRQFNISEKGEDPDAVTPEERVPAKAAPAAPAKPAATSSNSITAIQLRQLYALIRSKGISDGDQAKQILHNMAGVGSLNDLTKQQASKLLDDLKADDVDRAMLETFIDPEVPADE